jgi:polyisoprenoid-binding protein YceI
METIKWNLDPTHSELRFRIRHLMIANVSGAFNKFDVNMHTNGNDLATAQISVKADIDSISTGNEQRDIHLKNGDFFDAAIHPQLQFTSATIEKKDDENYTVFGDLTMKGVTRPVKLNVEYGGVTKDPWGNDRAGFVVTGKLNRSEWGISFNNILETGGVALSDEVKLSAEIQMVKEAVAVVA